MTDEKSSRRGLTRRSFLKSTAAAAGAVAVAGAASPTLTALAEGDTETSTAEHTAKCCCRCNCFGSCYIEVTVRDGKAVNLRPAAMKDEHYNRVCLRGLSHLTRIYDPDRVKYPMKRVGERGGGEWECIGWDEAIQLMADRFTEIREQYGNQAIAFWTALGNSAILNGGGGTPNFMTRFSTTFKAPTSMHRLTWLGRLDRRAFWAATIRAACRIWSTPIRSFAGATMQRNRPCTPGI